MVLVSTPCFGQAPEGSLREFPKESEDQVWKVGDRRWTVEEERRFEKWVDETITEDFFLRYGIPTDCADTVYAVRWVYARIAHLPAAATTTDGRLIGHWSTDWKDFPTDSQWSRDPRFLAALFYLFPRTWTGTLPLDTYPVRISPDSVRPGTLFLVKNSHAGIIGHVFLDGSQAHPLQAWESALPVRVQKLTLRYFFSPKPEARAGSGIVKFRWPVFENGQWNYLSLQEHPFYSEEQYAPGFCEETDFAEAVARKIDATEHAPIERMEKIMETITRLLQERVPIVQEGFEQCSNEGCLDAESEELYGTRGRDEMLTVLMDHLSEIIERNHLDKEKMKEKMRAVSIDISKNRPVTLYQIYQNRLWLSSQPEDSLEARWGLENCKMIHAQSRVTRDSIAFIDRVYRKKDPEYADFSIRQQQRLLGRLSEEWIQSGCRGRDFKLDKQGRPFSPEVSSKTSTRSKKCGAIRTEARATHDSIAFIEKTYRNSDPAYADFAIQQQKQVLRRLRGDWTLECREASPGE